MSSDEVRDASNLRTVSLDIKSAVWQPGFADQALGMLKREAKKPKFSISRIGKLYVSDSWVTDNLPHSLRFYTKRSLKKFLSKVVVVNSTAQFLAIFGQLSACRSKTISIASDNTGALDLLEKHYNISRSVVG